MALEIQQLKDCKTCRSSGKNARAPDGCQKIDVKMVFDVKQSLKRKARLVARGDQTKPPRETVCSGVASLRGLHIVCFLAELNGLKVTGGDAGNACLASHTKEKVVFKAGKEFGELEGHLCVIEKALCSLPAGGA